VKEDFWVTRAAVRPDTGTAILENEKTERPRRFKVLLLNDDYTTMDFVVYILESVFGKPRPEAVKIMLAVHKNGLGVAGVYIKAVAEAKIEQVHSLAREREFPLRCTIEPE
jgi:ATP-dependent Clp protease adaptor protein ClpS